MIAVIQRVKKSSVSVNNAVVGEIGPGLLVLLGVSGKDRTKDGVYLSEKISNLRIFEDADHRMNRSLLDMGGGNARSFTIHASRRLP